MKYKGLTESRIDPQNILNWIKRNLEGPASEYIIYDENNIRCTKVVTTEKIYEFPYQFVDVEFVRIEYADYLKNFNKFPDSSQDELSLIFTAAANKKTKIDWNDLPYYNEVRKLDFEFGYIDNNTTAHLSKYNNLNRVLMYNCYHDDLYDLSKYDIATYEYIIYPRKRIKNLTEFILNDKIDTKYFLIQDSAIVYSDSESVFLNTQFEHFNTKHYRKTKKDYVMDFTLDLIENGFEDDI